MKSVVRLKGGDPFLFGRARTEIETLRSNNIPYSYTPGISSCIAGPHLGGIPLTDPLLDCQSFGVWSGTDAFGKSWGGGSPGSGGGGAVVRGGGGGGGGLIGGVVGLSACRQCDREPTPR